MQVVDAEVFLSPGHGPGHGTAGARVGSAPPVGPDGGVVREDRYLHPHRRLTGRVPLLDLEVQRRRPVRCREAQINSLVGFETLIQETRYSGAAQSDQRREVRQRRCPGVVRERDLDLLDPAREVRCRVEGLRVVRPRCPHGVRCEEAVVIGRFVLQARDVGADHAFRGDHTGRCTGVPRGGIVGAVFVTPVDPERRLGRAGTHDVDAHVRRQAGNVGRGQRRDERRALDRAKRVEEVVRGHVQELGAYPLLRPVRVGDTGLVEGAVESLAVTVALGRAQRHARRAGTEVVAGRARCGEHAVHIDTQDRPVTRRGNVLPLVGDRNGATVVGGSRATGGNAVVHYEPASSRCGAVQPQENLVAELTEERLVGRDVVRVDPRAQGEGVGMGVVDLVPAGRIRQVYARAARQIQSFADDTCEILDERSRADLLRAVKPVGRAVIRVAVQVVDTEVAVGPGPCRLARAGPDVVPIGPDLRVVGQRGNLHPDKGRTARVPCVDFVIQLGHAIGSGKTQVVAGRRTELVVGKARDGLVQLDQNGEELQRGRVDAVGEGDRQAAAPCAEVRGSTEAGGIGGPRRACRIGCEAAVVVDTALDEIRDGLGDGALGQSCAHQDVRVPRSRRVLAILVAVVHPHRGGKAARRDEVSAQRSRVGAESGRWQVGNNRGCLHRLVSRDRRVGRRGHERRLDPVRGTHDRRGAQLVDDAVDGAIVSIAAADDVVGVIPEVARCPSIH